MQKRRTIQELKELQESEDRIEFKAAEQGNFSYNGSGKDKPAARRKCILGYVVAFCNEGGGSLVLGMGDSYPHRVLGTTQNKGEIHKLESSIYRDLGIRPDIYELYEDEAAKTGRVLVIDIPGRPMGKVFKFEDVPLMRVGEELRPMADDLLRSIWEEQEGDFSAELCPDISLEDIDTEAVETLKERYARKCGNRDFLNLSQEQILSDLGLTRRDGGITYAGLILVGKSETIQRVLPQASIVLEYRRHEGLIPYDNQQVYTSSFFRIIDNLWHDINLRNGKIDIPENAYIRNIPLFNENVVREAINNAVAHRDYRRSSEIYILQSPESMIIKNAGGFPLGVTKDNLLRVQSTPRNRLLSDVLTKTGVVERSGQGVDKIFKYTISEGKRLPDYSQSDSFRVELRLSAEIKDLDFALFLEAEQQRLSEKEQMSVFEILALNAIHEGSSESIDPDIINNLLKRGLIEKQGRTKAMHYTLSKSFYEFSGREGEYVGKKSWTATQARQHILAYFETFPQGKMKDFEASLQGHMTRKQVRSVVEALVQEGILIRRGKLKGTYYEISASYRPLDGSSTEILEPLKQS